jgi:glycosyltransferase involved in cell wall biosynthesis
MSDAVEIRNMPVIVISAINLRSGGSLSILQDCLTFLDGNLFHKYKIIALVHDKQMFAKTHHIKFMSFPKSVKSYLHRMYYEYYYFQKLSRELKPYLWFSLHDITPRVDADRRAVYCHNPAMAYTPSFNQVLLEPKFALFTCLYKFIYGLNIKKNNHVIVQQEWLRGLFKKIYNVDNLVVAHPSIEYLHHQNTISSSPNLHDAKFHFFYPTHPRVFKNIELIIDAVRILNEQGHSNFEVTITINGNENRYAKLIRKDAKNLSNINFIGRLSREKVFEVYGKCDCLLFPSKLETWGLPISEFKATMKPMLLADEAYAREAIGNYDLVSFFDSNKANVLSELMLEIMHKKHSYHGNTYPSVAPPFCDNWAELFEFLLRK